MKKISEYARAIQMRKEDVDLNIKFEKLPDIKKWEWLVFACKNNPINSLNFAKQLVEEF